MGLFIKRNDDLLITVLRFAGGAYFVWFGVSKLIHPELWYAGVPSWVWPYMPIPAESFILLQGVVEFLMGLAIILGRWVRVATGLAMVFLCLRLAAFGLNEVIVRDNALIGVYLALFINADRMSEKRYFPRQMLAVAVSAYLLILFVSGIIYLRT